MLRTIALATLFTALSTAGSPAEMIEKTSAHSVTVTIDRLEAAVRKAGATVFARVDHYAGAESVALPLNPSQLLIFGNPKLGTPAMQDSPTAGLDLPLRVLAYFGEDGLVRVVYHDPAELAEAHGLPRNAKYIEMMTGALDKLTNAAVAMN